MRVAAKIGWGAALLIALMIAVLAYDLALVNRLADVTDELSTLSFRLGKLALRGDRELAGIVELTQRYGVRFDPDYPERIHELEGEFTSTLGELSTLATSAGTQRLAEDLQKAWRRYRLRSDIDPQALAEFSTEDQDRWLDQQLASIAGLRGRLDGLLETLTEGLEIQVARAERLNRLAQRVSWAVVAVTLVLGALILGVTSRIITTPLSRLTRATRAVAEGRFFYELPESGGDEFSALARSFNEMVLRLGELDQMKRDFLSHVSHELRTPLVAMQETNELLLEGIPGPLTEKQQRLLELNIQGSRRLSAMISKLLDLSRMENGALEYDLRTHDLVELARDSVEELEARARDRQITLEYRTSLESLPIECDRDRIQQVLVNLLENAIKFSPDGETVHLSLTRAYPKSVLPEGLASGRRFRGLGSRAALVVVSDRGSGVPDADKQRVFEKFRQLSRVHRSEDVGIGLGLAICREIVEAHRGELWVEDNDDRGSRFTLLLPSRASSISRKRSEDEPSSASLAGTGTLARSRSL